MYIQVQCLYSRYALYMYSTPHGKTLFPYVDVYNLCSKLVSCGYLLCFIDFHFQFVCQSFLVSFVVKLVAM